jgi:hypothetical protein
MIAREKQIELRGLWPIHFEKFHTPPDLLCGEKTFSWHRPCWTRKFDLQNGPKEVLLPLNRAGPGCTKKR